MIFLKKLTKKFPRQNSAFINFPFLKEDFVGKPFLKLAGTELLSELLKNVRRGIRFIDLNFLVKFKTCK